MKDEEKAIVKSTGEILDVNEHYIVKNFTGTFTYDIGDIGDIDFSEFVDDELSLVNVSANKPEGKYYRLSDDKEYSDKEIVVGVDNIREYKLNKIL